MAKNHKLAQGLGLGVVTMLLGVALLLIPAVLELEESWGLAWMFNLRGPRPAPPEVVVISIDRESSRQLGLDERPNRWSRSVHAQMVDQLSRLGAEVIVFDVFFRDQREVLSDRQFANALKNAGNVILFARLNQRPVEIPNYNGGLKTVLTDQLIPPVKLIADSALSFAPFPLPKVPARVNQAWLFKSGSGDIPTLPVLALHSYAASVFEQILSKLGESPIARGRYQAESGQAHRADRLSKLVRNVRQRAHNKSLDLAESMLDGSELLHESRRHFHALRTLHYGPDNHYIYFYGPPQSIQTIPYHRVIYAKYPQSSDSGSYEFDFRGKAVFVGNSERYQPDLRDDFHTVFSSGDGFDLSGVEIIATVFANLLEGRSVKPFDRIFSVILVSVWGLAAGLAFYAMPAVVAIFSAVLFAGIYLASAAIFFEWNGHWLPLVVPLLIQLPFALFAALLLRFLLGQRERERIHRTTRYFLPGEVVDYLPEWNQDDLVDAGRVVQGVCLASDAESYASFAENLEPRELKNRLNQYFELLFSPVQNRGGVILDVVGDAMLAFWEFKSNFEETMLHACQAAIEIQSRTSSVGSVPGENATLPTRIGLHCGEMMIGNVGAGNHFEFRAVGDAINTTSRIEGLNKYLGTRVLVSAQVAKQVDAWILPRCVGKFRLKGKDNPIEIYELVDAKENVDPKFVDLQEIFLIGLNQFEKGEWSEAKANFESAVAKFGVDGPCLYYSRLCEHYLAHGSPASWEGVNMLAVK